METSGSAGVTHCTRLHFRIALLKLGLGAVDTPSLDERLGARPDPEAARKAFIARHPVGRIGSPSEIAALCVYLGSDESAFTTGQALVIDGAWGL